MTNVRTVRVPANIRIGHLPNWGTWTNSGQSVYRQKIETATSKTEDYDKFDVILTVHCR